MRESKILCHCCSVLLVLLLVAPAAGDLIPIDFSPFHNSRMQGEKGSAEYPEGDLVLGSIPFSIPAGGNNRWDAQNTSPNPHQINIPVDLYGVEAVYTLISTSWGQSGGPYAALEFYGSDGAFFRKDLYGNVDIRDWLWGYWTNSINGATTVNVFQSSGGFYYQARLDMQIIALPAAFRSQRLSTIRAIDTGALNFQRMLLYGITVKGIPDTPCVVDLAHFARFAARWLEAPCGGENDNCGGADLDRSGDVTLVDLRLFLDEWLHTCPPDWPWQ
ncbi:MAG: hypothetical protein JW810_06925 [Sedimentisphaerales bacterium]|nr:hypothetical protein [Sedimentisphaerales bacterium]